ncbi:hypothetical protein ACSBR2_005591 [Camellia fascicularis]
MDFVQVIVFCTVVSIYKAGQQAIDKVAQDSLIHWDLSLNDLACLQLKLKLDQTVEVSDREESLNGRLLSIPFNDSSRSESSI